MDNEKIYFNYYGIIETGLRIKLKIQIERNYTITFETLNIDIIYYTL